MSRHAAHGGLSVIETPELSYDAMYVAGPHHLLVGEAAHLRWRLWLGDQRRSARDQARAIVRDGLAHLVPTRPIATDPEQEQPPWPAKPPSR